MAKMFRPSNQRRGVAIALAIVFASILLLMALSMYKMIGQALPQNVVHDERIKVELVGQGLVDRAALKFQLCPAQFYAADAAKKAGYSDAMNYFLEDLTLVEDASSSFMVGRISAEITAMTLHTASGSHWNDEVLSIESIASYTSQRNAASITRSITRVFNTKRQVQTP